jgi:hypothetical protein
VGEEPGAPGGLGAHEGNADSGRGNHSSDQHPRARRAGERAASNLWLTEYTVEAGCCPGSLGQPVQAEPGIWLLPRLRTDLIRWRWIMDNGQWTIDNGQPMARNGGRPNGNKIECLPFLCIFARVHSTNKWALGREGDRQWNARGSAGCRLRPACLDRLHPNA